MPPAQKPLQRKALRAKSRTSAMNTRLARQPQRPGLKLSIEKRQPSFPGQRQRRHPLCTESPLWSASPPSRCQFSLRCCCLLAHSTTISSNGLRTGGFGLVLHVTGLYGMLQAHLAPVTSAQAAADVVAALLQNGKIQRATHNIMAYRIRIPGKDAFLQAWRGWQTGKHPASCLHACMHDT